MIEKAEDARGPDRLSGLQKTEDARTSCSGYKWTSGGREYNAAMLGCLRVFIAGLVLLVLAVAYLVGELPRIGVFALPALVVWTLPGRFWAAIRGRLHYAFAFQFWRKQYRGHLWQWANHTFCYLFIASSMTLAIPAAVVEHSDYLMIMALTWGSALVLLLLELIPRKNLRRTGNFMIFCCTVFLLVQFVRTFIVPVWSEKVALASPVRGEWLVLQGGRSSLFNHHFRLQSQRYALDLLKYEDGRQMRGKADNLESYFAYGQPLFVPADGVIVRVVDYRPDQAIGSMDTSVLVGNHVVIDMGEGKYILLAHMLRGSIRVREGQRVKAGQLLGRCGNSGNTTMPHLHIQVQSSADWRSPDLKTFPIYFRDVQHIRWGMTWSRQHGELVRNDRVKSRSPDNLTGPKTIKN